jgi:hypothetical protein
MNPQRDPSHQAVRSFLRLVGPLMILAGLILTIIGFSSFFSNFNSFPSGSGPHFTEPGGMASRFWCAFVGIPLLAAGIGLTKFAFLGAAARYVSNEVSPVAKDTASYLLKGTKGAVREVAAAVADGIRAGSAGEPGAAGLRCPRCGGANGDDASFCKACGATLVKAKACLQCGRSNDGDARFCNGCGAPIS